jgi:hypothetical protein
LGRTTGGKRLELLVRWFIFARFCPSLIAEDGAAPADRRAEPVLGRGAGANSAGGAGTLQTSGKEICIPVIDLPE